eukprot:9238787-Pyramimonas_sp.AAC.1
MSRSRRRSARFSRVGAEGPRRRQGKGAGRGSRADPGTPRGPRTVSTCAVLRSLSASSSSLS